MSSGGDGILTITGFGRFEKLHAEYNRLLQRVAKLEAELKKAKQASKELDDAQEEAASTVSDKIEGLAAKWLTVTQAVNLYNAAIMKQKELASDALNKSMDIAAAQIELMGNVGANATRAQRLGIINRVAAAGPGLGLNPDDAMRAAGLISASVPGTDPMQREKTMMDLMALAVKFFPTDPNNRNHIGDLGRAAGGLMTAMPGLSADKSMKVMAGLLAQSHLSDASKLPNVTQALVTAQNESPKVKDQFLNLVQAASMTGALSQRLQDPDGEISRTAMANFFTIFRQQAPEYADRPIWDAVKEAREKNPNLIRKIIPKLLGRAFTKSPQKGMLQEQGVEGKLTEMVLSEMEITDDSWNTFLEDLSGGTPDIKRARALRRVGAATAAGNVQRRATSGTVHAMLFGGQIGDEKLTGVFPETSSGMGGVTSDWLAEQSYWAYVNAGASPQEAAFHVIRNASRMTNVPLYGPMLGGGNRDAAGLRKLEAVFNEIKQLPAVIEDNSAQISNGQNAQAAAAQRGAQTE